MEYVRSNWLVTGIRLDTLRGDRWLWRKSGYINVEVWAVRGIDVLILREERIVAQPAPLLHRQIACPHIIQHLVYLPVIAPVTDVPVPVDTTSGLL